MEAPIKGELDGVFSEFLKDNLSEVDFEIFALSF